MAKLIPGENDLATQKPELAAQWHPTKNNGLTPKGVLLHSNKKVWWCCPEGHEWEAKINNRVSKNNNCPYCSGRKILPGYNDLATTHPDLAKEWHPTRNEAVSPRDVSKGTIRTFWWLGKCGHEWKASIGHRTGGQGCPICNGKQALAGHNDLATTNPALAAEWHPTKNGALTPQMVTEGSDRKVWWFGPCGHEWQAAIGHRARGTGCPVCLTERHTSFPEQAILYYMRKVTPAESRNTEFGKEMDVWLPELRVGVEYNGFWHRDKAEADAEKISFFSGLDIRIITVKEGEQNLVDGDVIQYVYSAAQKEPLCWAIKELFRLLSLQAPEIDVSSDTSEIYSQYITSWKESSLSAEFPELAAQWHPTKNGTISPEQVAPRSDKKVWWQCEKGHEWQATPNNRSAQSRGCPYCSGKKILSGYNDLATTHPDLAAEWHPTNNHELLPSQVTFGSTKKVWWLGKCGHEWEATVNNRFNHGCGCPICAGQKILAGFNDLATTHPDLATEWHPTKNGELLPSHVMAGSDKKVWWLGKCGHEWPAALVHRSKSVGCPICAGKQVLIGYNDLTTMCPKLAAEWHPTKNGKLTPQDVTCRSGKKVWWRCQNGHEWETKVAHRSNGSGCPICSGRKQKEF